jgi:phosphoribosylamine--glycine ligase
MNILLLGGGGREHALAHSIVNSPLCKQLFVAPGNGGTHKIATNIDINVLDFDAINKVIEENLIDFVIVGPDDPLAMGVTDAIHKKFPNVAILGPNKVAAQLESSKSFAKDFMIKHEIPTAKAKVFTKEEKHLSDVFLNTCHFPIVIKADGLAAGKGVQVCETLMEAQDFIQLIWEHNKFGDSGYKILIEEFLVGIEVSMFILTDGINYIQLPEAKDYKRIGEGDTGLNTGGMGTISPVPFVTENFKQKVIHQIIEPTITGLQKEGIDYRGFLFLGLMNVDGNPYVIEYNVRMGDPETQVVFPRIKTDMLPLMLATAQRKLTPTVLDINQNNHTAVILVSEGYPAEYEKGKKIKIPETLENFDDVLIFHAGTKLNHNQVLETNGGRVLAVVGIAKTLKESIDLAYEYQKNITFDNKFLRFDIGKDLLGM